MIDEILELGFEIIIDILDTKFGKIAAIIGIVVVLVGITIFL